MWHGLIGGDDPLDGLGEGRQLARLNKTKELARGLLRRARIRAPFDDKIILLNDGKTATPEVESTVCWQAARGRSYPC
jgi:hypothetical protein